MKRKIKTILVPIKYAVLDIVWDTMHDITKDAKYLRKTVDAVHELVDMEINGKVEDNWWWRNGIETIQITIFLSPVLALFVCLSYMILFGIP